jgi:dTDP-4-dehydrorhamnose reductase
VRVLILGGDGMIGSGLARQLVADHEVAVTVRRTDAVSADGLGVPPGRVYGGVDLLRFDSLVAAVADFRPDAVVNAVGVVKQKVVEWPAQSVIELNALVPHRLAAFCRAADIRFVHLSSDCVFSGQRGGYTEADEPDPVDMYGMTKALGEPRDPAALTLRTSTIGLELGPGGKGLVEWFLASSGRLSGYRRAIYTGVTTMELGRLLGRILTRHEDLAGLWQVAAEPVTKFDLLTALADRLGRTDVEVVADDGVVCDRSMSAERLHSVIGYAAPGWPAMIEELAVLIERRATGSPAAGVAAASRSLTDSSATLAEVGA